MDVAAVTAVWQKVCLNTSGFQPVLAGSGVFFIKDWSAELWGGGFPSSYDQFSRNTEHHSIDPRTGCPKTRPSPSKHGVL